MLDLQAKLEDMKVRLPGSCAYLHSEQEIGVGKVVSQGAGVTLPKIGSIVGIKWSASACLSCGTITFERLKDSGFTYPMICLAK
jgi:hypothetical protein